jgi:hypothetical protein
MIDFTDQLAVQEQPASQRVTVAERLRQFDERDSPWTSRSQIARELDVPNSTLQAWLQQRRTRLANSGQPREVVQFFEKSAGLAFLHQLLTAGQLVFVQGSNCGLRNFCQFLELSGLNDFVAASYGAQQAVAEEMELLLSQFGEQEDKRLAAHMPPREISIAEDETFHPHICLVSMDLGSNFILLEQYEAKRDASTWNRCLDDRLAFLPITVCQVVSDEAKALLSHTQIHLGVHHSPDLFHVQQETTKATGGALARQTQGAQEAWEKAQQQSTQVREQLAACREQCAQSSHVQELEQKQQDSEENEAVARQHLSACQDRQQRATTARQGLGQDYHPFDRNDGRALTAEEVATRLTAHFDALDQVALEARLSSGAQAKLAKARRMLGAMQATIAFFWKLVAVRLSAWNLSEPVQQWMREQLIPGHYLGSVASKAKLAEERTRLRKLSEQILARARDPTGLWGTLDAQQQTDLEHQAQECAELFQRSSSCVEGRNGQLSLKHHALHHLTTRKLRTLTVLHNYFVRRPDGTTAAERFYDQPPRDPFTWLLGRLSHPARPRASRSS